MQTNVLEYLENTVNRVPDKAAFADDDTVLSFRQVYDQAKAVGSFLNREGFYKKPIVIFMKRQPKTLVAFLGAIYAGCYYIPLDEDMPQYRMDLIFKMLDPGAVICDEVTRPMMDSFDYGKRSICLMIYALSP